ncbi:MAG: hypothetical protein ACJ8F7_22705 [Gemmataceae bacterium]
MSIQIGLAQYEDGIIALLKSAGVHSDEIEQNRTSEKLAHAHLKGIDFAVAARALLEEHGVTIQDGAT